MTRITGNVLADKWKVSVQQALYHHEGTWYHVLERFPSALFDPNGYIVFKSKQDLMNHGDIRIRQHMNVPGGISLLAGYQQAPKD